MTAEEMELVELIATKMVEKYNDKFPNTRKGDFKSQPSHVRDGLLEQAEAMLSVVKARYNLVPKEK